MTILILNLLNLYIPYSEVFLPSVRNVTLDFALKYFCEPAIPMQQRNNSIKQISVKTLQELLSNNLLNTPYEELVWEAIVTWAYEQNRKTEDIALLIETVRFGYLRPLYIIQAVSITKFWISKK